MSEEDRLLFEQAVEKLSDASRSRIGRLKQQGTSPKSLVRRSRPSARLDRLNSAPEASIDLHGLRRLDAERALQRFLSDRRRGEVVLVVHGKGSGKLREHVNQLIAEHPRIAESRRAPQRLGGEGALLVRLKR